MSENEGAFWRKFVLPQEERMALGIPYRGGYRWFRSPNVIPIEQWRKRKRKKALAESTAPSAA